MENMNLATRCREAIAQVAALKKELATYQQKQHSLSGEYDGLKREIGVLRRQMIHNNGKNNGHVVGNGVGNTAASAAAGATQNNVLPTSNSTDEKMIQPPPSRDYSSSPTTDLDRIMSLQKFGGTVVKKQSSISEASSVSEDSTEKDKFDNTSATNTIVSSNSKIPIAITAPNNPSASSNISTAQSNDDEFDADIDMVDFFTKQSIGSGTAATTAAAQQPNTKSLHHHVRKVKSHTDDVMPEDNINGVGLGFSPEGKKGVVGDSLLSSLDGECFHVLLLFCYTWYQQINLSCLGVLLIKTNKQHSKHPLHQLSRNTPSPSTTTLQKKPKWT
jgi:hypothetical protein